MDQSNDTVNLRLISKISSMYYNQEYNQQEIADRLHLSRSKVSRLLKQARKQGIVQITVVSPNGDFVDLEHNLEERFDLKEVILAESDKDMSPDVIKKQIGSAAAAYLNRSTDKSDVIGVTWGTTLQAMVDSLQPQSIDDLHVVQALGGVGPPEAKAHASDISRRLSQILNAKLTLLPAPGIVGTKQAKEVLLSDQRVKRALDLFSEINTLYVGIGALDTNPVLHKDNQEIPPELLEKISNSSAIGDIALHFFDIDGNEVDSKLKEVVIGISIEQLKQIDNVVGIAGGDKKVDVIYGALKGGLIDVLITDSQTAQNILAKN